MPEAPSALVTGATGFVGAGLVRGLLARGWRVTALLRRGVNWRLAGVADAIDQVPGSVDDPTSISQAIARSAPTAVFHLAAYGAYPHQRDFARAAEVNVLGAMYVGEACARAEVRLVAAGSSSEYGHKDHPPAEDEPLEPAGAYGSTKAAAAFVLQGLARTQGLDVVLLRLYSVYGPWEEPGRFVPALVTRGLRGELPPLVRAAVARDFVYLDDVVDCMVAAATAAGRGWRVFNVATGRQVTIGEAVQAARRLFGITQEPQWATMADRTWDTETWVGDAVRAGQELGWMATTNFDAGLQKTAAWFREDPERVRFYEDRMSRPPAQDA